MTVQIKKRCVLRLAAVLCLLALTVGCAACATNRTGSGIDESVAGVDSVTLGGSGGAELNAEQSEKSGEVPVEVSVDQSAEELMVPVGTKTTVEKIASYPIGEGEAFQYAFELCGTPGPEEAISPYIPIAAQVDEKEDLYLAYWCGPVTRLRDGKQWETRSWDSLYDFVISNESLYMMFESSVVEQYDMEGNLIKRHSGCADRKLDATIPCVDADGRVYLKADCQNHFYRLDGTDIPGEQVPFRIGTADTNVQRVPETMGGMVRANGSVFVTAYTRDSYSGTGNYEQMYSVHHADGTLLSNCHFTMLYAHEMGPCSLPHGINYTYFSTVSVDDTVFDHVLDGYVVVGANGSLYLVLYLENKVELYRITPGHTDGPGFGVPKEQTDAS